MIDRKRGYYDEAQETMPAAKRAQAQREMLRDDGAPRLRARAGDPAEDGRGGRPPRGREGVADLRRIPLTRKADLKHIQKGEPPFGGPGRRAARGRCAASTSPRARRSTRKAATRPTGAGRSRSSPRDSARATSSRTPSCTTFRRRGSCSTRRSMRIGCTVIPAGVGNTELQAQVMKELDVTGYVGTPSFLMTILEKAKEMGYHLRRRPVAPGRPRDRRDVPRVAADAVPRRVRRAGPPVLRHGRRRVAGLRMPRSERDARPRRDPPRD